MPAPDRPEARVDASPARAPDAVGRVILAAVAVAVYARIYFGFDFFDKAYYLALPYAFSLGYQPFLDEQAVHQLGGPPDLVVRMRCIPGRPPTRLALPPGDPVSALFQPPEYEIRVERACYSVARRADLG